MKTLIKHHFAFAATLMGALILFAFSHSAYAVVRNYAACISAPLPTVPKSPNWTGTVRSAGAAGPTTYTVTIWRETCAADSSQSVILLRLVPSQGRVTQFTPDIIQAGRSFSFVQFEYYTAPSAAAGGSNTGERFFGDVIVPTTVLLQQGRFETTLVDENAAMTMIFNGLSQGDTTIEIPAKTGGVTPPAPTIDYTAMWWNASESGWGMSVIQSPTTRALFSVIYSYASDRRANWFVLPGGTWTSNTVFTGTLYQTSGPPFNASPFDPNAINVTNVGTATLTFSAAGAGTLQYTVNGVQVSKAIVRQAF